MEGGACNTVTRMAGIGGGSIGGIQGIGGVSIGGIEGIGGVSIEGIGCLGGVSNILEEVHSASAARIGAEEDKDDGLETKY